MKGMERIHLEGWRMKSCRPLKDGCSRQNQLARLGKSSVLASAIA